MAQVARVDKVYKVEESLVRKVLAVVFLDFLDGQAHRSGPVCQVFLEVQVAQEAQASSNLHKIHRLMLRHRHSLLRRFLQPGNHHIQLDELSCC